MLKRIIRIERKIKRFFSTNNIEIESEKKIKKNKYDCTKLVFGSSARHRLLKGVSVMSDTVSKSYGPLGKNVLIDYNNNAVITKDGVTIAKNISLSDRSENIGCRLLSLISGSTNEFAGDGTTTSTILAGEIVKRGIALVDIGFHPMDLKRGIEVSLKLFLQELEKLKFLIRNKKDLFNLAMITTNKNEEISEIVSEALINLGISGLLSLEESPIGENRLIIYQGMNITYGFASNEFSSEKSITLEDPLILIYSGNINSNNLILQVLEFAKTLSKPLIIFCQGIKKEPLSLLVYNKVKEILNCVVVTIPDYVDDKSNIEVLDDLSIVTGAKLCTLKDLEDFSPEEIFGISKRIVVTEFDTQIIGPDGDKEMIKQRLVDIKRRIKIEDYKPILDRLKQRLNYLEGKTGIITVGGYTEVEVAENRDKIVDCLNSCRSAIEHGILPGGGTAFLHALKVLNNVNHENSDMNAGNKIFKEAIIDTLRHLFKNSKMLLESAFEKININNNNNFGYDIVTERYYENMINEGIIDSFNTIKTSLEDSVSIASLIITTECIVYKEENYEPSPLDFYKNKIKTDPVLRTKWREDFEKISDKPLEADEFLRII